MTASFTLSICFWNESLSRISKEIVLVAMFVYIGGYQVGFGPITWYIVSEVFPLEVRGKAIALGVELNYVLNFFVQLHFPRVWGLEGVLLCLVNGQDVVSYLLLKRSLKQRGCRLKRFNYFSRPNNA